MVINAVNGWKWLERAEIAVNGCKWLEWPEMAGNSCKGLEMDRAGRKQLEMTGMAGND